MSDNTKGKENLPRVLVVENDPQWRQDHLKNLADWGYEAYAAEAPEDADNLFQALWDDAIKKAHDYRCHIALVDMRLRSDGDPTDRTGLELVSHLAPTVSIIVSGYGDKDTVRAAIKSPPDVPLRAYDFVGKESGPEELEKTIEEVKLQYWGRFTKELIKWPFSIGGSEQLIKRLFPDQDDVPVDEIEDLLWKLYPDAQQLAVHSLESDDRFPSAGSVRPRSVVIRINRDGNAISDIVKIVRTDPTRDESTRYKKYVEDKFPLRYYATLKSEAVLWDVQGTRYLNVGDVGALFRIYYQERQAEDICTVLNNFGSGWKSYYDAKKEKGDNKVTLYQAYRALWGNNWHNRFGASAGALEKVSPEFQAWFSEQLKLPDPITWLKQRIALEQASETNGYIVSQDYSPKSIPMCVIHGDLQADNCFIDETTKQLWLIDFERSGPGPIFADWVELEIDILTRLLRVLATKVSEFLHLVVNLLSSDPVKFWEPDLPSGASTDTVKAFEAIKTIRKHAKATTGDDTRPYRWALLLNTAFRLTLPMRKEDNPIEEGDLPLDERCALLGGTTCRSLDSGQNDAWPPKSWSNPKKPSFPSQSSPSVSTTSSFEYDVFISYSSKDRAWVVAELLPRLKAANLKVCIDFIDFEPGAPSVIEMERAIKTSRKTVAILTQNYMDSGWTEFENLMLQTLDSANRERRFVPLRKEKVELPLRIAYLVYVDFADPEGIELSWEKLLKASTPSDPNLTPA